MPNSSRAPRLYTIPPSAPFLTTLARAVLNGDLPCPRGVKPDALTLPLATLYLPTRRAVRGLRDAFLDVASGLATLLPSIRALGDPDEDAASIFGAEDSAEDGYATAAAAPAIGTLPRRLVLMRLVLAWGEALRKQAIAEPSIFGVERPSSTPAQASYLAADLANLMDIIEREEVDLASLQDLVPEAHAAHWQRTVDFLKIVTEHWPEYLRAQGLVSPAARRNMLMGLEAARLASQLPARPVIAAGSTGTVPATARLLAVIASLPNGAVVLPGLDLSLDDESWASLPEHPEHPQAGMAELLAKLGVTRADVAYVPGSEPSAKERSRLSFVAEVLRPSGQTDRWQEYLRSAGGRCRWQPECAARMRSPALRCWRRRPPMTRPKPSRSSSDRRSRLRDRRRRSSRRTGPSPAASPHGSRASIWRLTILQGCRLRAPCPAPFSTSCWARRKATSQHPR